jgi:DNA polymerase-3 subunit delta
MARGRRAASAGESLRSVMRESEAGWAPGLTVLTGGDLYHLDQAQRALIGALVPGDATDFALTTFGEQRVDVSVVVSAVRSVGMFAEERVVFVRDVAALDGDPEPLAAYAKSPPASSFLIVRAPELDRRRKLHQLLSKAGRLIEFPAAGLEELVRLGPDVAALAAEKGIALGRPAAAMLAEICGGDFYRIASELEKIRAWRGKDAGEELTPEGLREVVGGSAALSGWEVAGGLLRHDRAAALAALERLVGSGEEPLRLLGGLAYRARSMLVARAMIERGVPATRAVAAARIWGEAPAAAAAGLKRYTLGQVMRFPSLLLQADRTLKSRSIEPRAVLGSMLEQMIP